MINEVEIITPLQSHHFIESFYELSIESHFWVKWRFEAFLKQLGQLKIPAGGALQVLDVGSGRGTLRNQIEAATDWTVDITDLDYKALQESASVRGRTFYYDILEKRPEWREKYDAIMLFDVLEHIELTGPFIDALQFHLKSRGFLFINVPALPVLFSRYDEVQNHFRRYTIPTLTSEFSASDLRILDIRYWGLLNVPPLLVRRFWLNAFSKGKSDEEIFQMGFAPPSMFINGLFMKLMKLELALPGNRFAGSSILMAARKT